VPIPISPRMIFARVSLMTSQCTPDERALSTPGPRQCHHLVRPSLAGGLGAVRRLVGARRVVHRRVAV
jgi:hypothetical protein